MKTYLDFIPIEYSEPRKTKGWTVSSNMNGGILGKVEWYAHWRQYVFKSLLSVYDQSCLTTIADFLEKANTKHKNK